MTCAVSTTFEFTRVMETGAPEKPGRNLVDEVDQGQQRLG